MSVRNDLLLDLVSSLNVFPEVQRGFNVTEKPYIWQIIQSAAACCALFMVYQAQEDRQVSVQSFKNKFVQECIRLCEIFSSHLNMDSRDVFEQAGNYAEKLYELYLNLGYLYHSNHNVHRPRPCCSKESPAVCRGMIPQQDLCFSGAGFYTKEIVPESVNQIPLINMFQFHSKSFEEDFLSMLESSSFLEDSIQNESIQFLETNRKSSHSYWKSYPDTDGRISLLRVGQSSYEYRLYQYKNEKRLTASVPYTCFQSKLDGSFSNGEYLWIAAAVLKQSGSLPPIVFTRDSRMKKVEIRLGYRLPVQEQNFFDLFCWTDRPFQKAEFHGIMQEDIFFEFKKILQKQGYEFMEKEL